MCVCVSSCLSRSKIFALGVSLGAFEVSTLAVAFAQQFRMYALTRFAEGYAADDSKCFSTTVAVQEGCEEMVVDVYRMINAKGKSKEDPMARFNKMDDPKDGFKARWDLPQV